MLVEHQGSSNISTIKCIHSNIYHINIICISKFGILLAVNTDLISEVA
jgi:hypothetical protein